MLLNQNLVDCFQRQVISLLFVSLITLTAFGILHLCNVYTFRVVHFSSSQSYSSNGIHLVVSC